VIALLILLSCGPKLERGPIAAEEAQKPVRILSRPDPSSPNVYLEAIVAAGSAYDTVGREGLAALTAMSLVEGGAGERTGTQLKEALQPTGNEIEILPDREWVSVRLRCHRDHAALCVELFADVLTDPRFEAPDVGRVRDELLYTVTEGLLADEEALAREVLDGWLFEGHPYGHPIEGRSGVLPLLDEGDATAFFREHYRRGAMVAGIAGGFDAATEAELARRLEAVPQGLAAELILQDPPTIEGRNLLAVDTETPVTGYFLGHTLDVRRDHPDWPALYLAFVAFGEHRQSHGRLFRELRTARGLNYGDYAYAEPFVQRGWSSMPEQGVLRRQPTFTMWLRPTGVENGPFLLKLALAELERFVDEGLGEAELEDMRKYALSRLALFAVDPGRRLAYDLDAAATGQPNPLELLRETLPKLTRDDVNAAVKRHVDPKKLKIVAVSGDAEGVAAQLFEGNPTPIVYAEGVTPTEAQSARDAEVARRTTGLGGKPRVVAAEGIFR
jgi:zinc protease